MRQANKRIPESAEKTVRDIRRATRRGFNAFGRLPFSPCSGEIFPVPEIVLDRLEGRELL
jgi:hypothetical protein